MAVIWGGLFGGFSWVLTPCPTLPSRWTVLFVSLRLPPSPIPSAFCRCCHPHRCPTSPLLRPTDPNCLSVPLGLYCLRSLWLRCLCPLSLSWLLRPVKYRFRHWRHPTPPTVWPYLLRLQRHSRHLSPRWGDPELYHPSQHLYTHCWYPSWWSDLQRKIPLITLLYSHCPGSSPRTPLLSYPLPEPPHHPPNSHTLLTCIFYLPRPPFMLGYTTRYYKCDIPLIKSK